MSKLIPSFGAMMAIGKMSGIGITELSGKFGGTVAAKNKSGFTIRRRVKGTNPRTNSQITKRAQFSSVATAWRGLTDAERLAWEQAAASGEWDFPNRVGDRVQPSGEQLYTRLNNTLTDIGATNITEPPLKASFSAITLGALTATAGTPALSQAFTGSLTADESLVWYGTYGVSAGISRPSNFRKLTVTTAASPANLLASYNAVFGALIEGKKIFIKAEIVNELTGQRQLVGQSQVTVAA